MKKTIDIIRAAKAAAPILASASPEQKNLALEKIARRLILEQDNILRSNAEDIEASRGRLGPVMIDRLSLNPQRIAGMAQGIREVMELQDPVGKVLARVERPNGLIIEKTSFPLGTP